MEHEIAWELVVLFGVVMATVILLIVAIIGPGIEDNERARKNLRSAQSYVDERRAITDATISAMRSGTFYGRGKEVVEGARAEFRSSTQQ